MAARKSGPGPEPAGAGEAVQTLVPDLERIRAHVAANGQGITRDEAILEELTKLLHAKVQDELRGGGEAAFRVDPEEPAAALRGRIDGLLAAAGAARSDGSEPASIALDDACLAFAVAALQDRRLRGAARDVVGEAYESLIFPSLRGGQGQFFTPKNVARCIAEILDVGAGARVIDPACGTGGFLLEVARHARARGREVALHGVDKDALLARLAADSLHLQAGGAAVVCANSLSPPEALEPEARAILAPGTYDAVITNPPFGAKIPVSGEALLGRFELARRWTFDRKAGRWRADEALREAAPPQVLFVERCLDLLKEGGRCGIVLPEGILGNQGTGYVRQWLLGRADVLAVIDCPVETFMPHTSTKTAVIVVEKRASPRRPAVFMAVAERCGHDRRGTPLVDARGRPDDDFPRVIAAWRRHRAAVDAEGRA